MNSITNLITTSSLSEVDKHEFNKVLEAIPEEYQDHISELILHDPQWIVKLSDNLKKKRQAIDSGDEKLWNAILKEEEGLLTSMTV